MVDVNVAPGSVALSSSIVPGLAKSRKLSTELAHYYRTVYTSVRTACATLLFIIRTRLQLRAARRPVSFIVNANKIALLFWSLCHLHH